ncbi:MAG TPA: ABC transporter ATP-binding protein [Acidimicrobiales bacterium]|jgi:peptide/nickel transport system ATP-binding protein|nr:ABC transporter ATP-binding protein [Acidimicrobiales bacterium]
MTPPPLLEIEALTVVYPSRRRHPTRPAVDRVTLAIAAGESVGLVGESGSGKTTIGRAVLGLVTPSSGRITFDGTDITAQPAGRRGPLSAQVQVVFQDPVGSLNPVRTVGQSLAEPMAELRQLPSEEALGRVAQVLERVGLPGDAMNRYPHQFSGGQRQRIAIARALAVEPRLIVCDEPVSALDVSTQAQVLNLFDQLRRELGLSYLFIGHNLAVVRHVCQRLVVLYRGQVMETGPADAVTDSPWHPYTQALVAAAPVADVARQRQRRETRRSLLTRARTTVPTDAGCPFATRCPYTAPVCIERRPATVTIGPSAVACHRYDETSGHPSLVSIRASAT